MTDSNKPAAISTHRPLAYAVKCSNVHGKGVFARRNIPAGSRIVEYGGDRITWSEALRRSEGSNAPINHTFFFTLSDGKVIDGDTRGNDARWINHACEPNCEAVEDNGRVYIHALRDIRRGEEVNYSYPLIYEGRHTSAVKRAFECRCGTSGCVGSMLAPKRRKKRKT